MSWYSTVTYFAMCTTTAVTTSTSVVMLELVAVDESVSQRFAQSATASLPPLVHYL